MSAASWHLSVPKPAFSVVLCRLLPRRIRRMLLLASLYNFLTSEQFEESTALLKLNRELGLCHSPEALKFPLAVSSALWGTTKPEGFNIPEQKGPLYKLAEDILKRSPKSLRYATNVEMRTDILHLLAMVV